LCITETAKSGAIQVDFTLSESEFSASSAVDILIGIGGQDSVVEKLVSTSNAIAHFDAKLNGSVSLLSLGFGSFQVRY
jgi:hypothetical protein